MTLDQGYLLYGRYRVESILGRGGMGAVYHATDENLGIAVALKENLFTTEEYARQFRREASLLAGLRHPNLPRVTDHFVIPGQGQYLVMDFIEGDDLRMRLDRGNIPNERIVVEWTRQICDALQYLHSRQPPVIHRDIKPGNIRITPDGRAILVDFGLARVMEGLHTTTGAKAMTPGYSPPEQYGASRTDARTDIYALAATLYTLLTGALSEDGLERALGQKTLTPIRARNPKVSAGVAAAVEKALEILPENRFQTIEDFREVLLAGIPQSSTTTATKKSTSKEKPVPPIAQAKPRFPKISIGCAIAFFVFFIVFGAIAVSAMFSGDNSILAMIAPSSQTDGQPIVGNTASPIDPLIPTPTPTPEPQNQSDVPTETPNELPTLLPTSIYASEWIAFVSDQTGIPQIYLMDSEGGQKTQLTFMEEGACQPDWSPDGLKLLFISPCRALETNYVGTTIFEINPDGTGMNTLTKIPGGDFDPAWSPDGKLIAFTSLQDGRSTKGIYLMDPKGNNRIRLSAVGAVEGQPRWSPDGKRIVFTSYSTGMAVVYTMDAVTSKELQKRRQISNTVPKYEKFPSASPDWSPDNINILFLLSSSNGQMWLARESSPSSGSPRWKDGTRSTIARFSPNGMWIIFDMSVDLNVDLYRLPAIGSDVPIRLTSDPSRETDPAWRPVPS